MTYAVVEMVEETTNEQRTEDVIRALEATFFHIDSTELVANNRYRITATCSGG